MKNKIYMFILAVMLSFFSLMTITAEAANDSANSQIPYNSYSYWEDVARTPVHTKPIYKVKAVLDYSDMNLETQFTELTDVFATTNGYVYLLDGGASRLIVLDQHYEKKAEINSVYDGNAEYTFKGAKGIFADAEGKIYISDTENGRVLVCKEDGSLVTVYYLPDSRLIPDSFDFRPIKTAVDSQGYIYVLSDGSYYGAILYSKEGEFLGFYGANTVKNTVGEAISNIWNRLILNDEKRAAMEVKLPYQFTDLCIDTSDFVYTATGNTSEEDSNKQMGQIRKLSPGGKDVFQSDSMNYGDEGIGRFEQDILGISVSDDGFIYALDSAYGHIFVYDQNSSLLGIFGNGSREGQQEGSFSYATSISLSGNDVIVTDSKMNTLTIFEITEYGELLKQAVLTGNEGDYASAKELWEEVISQDKQCQLAYEGLGKCYYDQGDYKKSLEYSKVGCDKETYALAFEQMRNTFIYEHFTWLVLGAIILGLTIWKLSDLKKKRGIVFFSPKMRLAISALRNPRDAFIDLKVYRQGSYFVAIGFLVVYYISAVMKVTNGGFSYVAFDTAQFNALLILIRTVGLVLLFTLCFWAMSTLQGGLGKIGEIFITVCYSLQPLIIANVTFIILTNVMTPSEIGFLELFMSFMTIYAAFILCMGLMSINNFEFGKFSWVFILTVASMAVVLFVGLVVMMLIQLIVGFIKTIIFELYKIMTYGG